MADKTPTYNRQIVEIADILFANPDRKMSAIISDFVVKCRKSYRTVERYFQKAQEYNKKRLQEQEKIKDEVMGELVMEAAKSDILNRIAAEEILSNIAKGVARKVKGEVIIPSDSDRVRAITQLSKMNGWDAVKKLDMTTGGEPISKLSVSVNFTNMGSDGH